MNDQKKKTKRTAQIPKTKCVACGTCVKECPRNAIEIVSGVFAKVNPELCVGCGKCEKACPASIIEILTLKEVI